VTSDGLQSRDTYSRTFQSTWMVGNLVRTRVLVEEMGKIERQTPVSIFSSRRRVVAPLTVPNEDSVPCTYLSKLWAWAPKRDGQPA